MRKGFTLLETVMATSIMALVMAAAMGTWILFLHKSNRVNQQSMLDIDARNVVEMFRAELRNAARETIIFFPKNEEPYKAIGFALAEDTDNDGLMDTDADGSILWRQTVIYHVWKQENPPQMRRTVFSNRDNDLSYEEYYDQIATVYAQGEGVGEHAKTEILIRNLFAGKLWHDESFYDGYAPIINTLDRETFGSVPLGPGEHTLDLIMSGKHPEATGNNIRLDQLSLGVSGWPLEAERRVTSGATASKTFIGPNQAGAAYGLHALTSDGDKLSLTLYNDAIEEAQFIGKGRNVIMSNAVVRFEAELPPDGYEQGAYVVKLDGQYALTWTAEQQSGSSTRSIYYNEGQITNCVVRIPIISRWMAKDGYGPIFRMYKSKYNNHLDIPVATFAVVPPLDLSDPKPDIDPDAEIIDLEFYQNGIKKAGWAACTSQDYVDLRPKECLRIDEESTLMLTFQITVRNVGTDKLTAFPMNTYTDLPGSWMFRGGDANVVYQKDWPDGDTEVFDELPSLEDITVNYIDGGNYISHVYDTKSDAHAPKTIEWEVDQPDEVERLTMYARSGDWISDDGFEIVDGTEWERLNPIENGGSMGIGRYLQFRAVMQAKPWSQYPGESGGSATGPYCIDTPRLHHVLITWDGEAKYVDVMGSMLKSPDCGRFKVEVDGAPLIRGVRIEIEIFKDINTSGGRKERLRSAMMAEVEPRNSNKGKK